MEINAFMILSNVNIFIFNAGDGGMETVDAAKGISSWLVSVDLLFSSLYERYRSDRS